MLVGVTEYFGKKVEEMIQPLEEENKHLLTQLTEVKEKLQHSMEDNEYFKYLIDKLE
jgi:regulator of replication initiation timing